MDELIKNRMKCLYTKILCGKSMLPLLFVDYFRSYHRILNLKNPDTVGAKIQWIKKYGNLERYTDLADKYKVRDYVAEKIGEEYLPKIYGVFENSNEIEFEKLPSAFVLKCNHCSGQVYVCKDKSKVAEIEWKDIKRNLDDWISINFYHVTGERQYRDIKRKIICEEYLEDDSGALKDYKIYCFNGKPEYISVNVNPHTENRTVDYFDLEWNKASEFNCVGDINCSKEIKKPNKLNAVCLREVIQ